MNHPNKHSLGWRDRIRQTIGFDVRSLALFRICLGIMIIADLLLRSQTMSAMYTDDGYFNREMARGYAQIIEFSYGVESPTYWSFHDISGSLEWQIALFATAALLAVMLIFGWMTRTVTILSWILLVSLQSRNPMILTSGDILFKMLAFWSMFLPLGKIWSVDAWRRQKHKRHDPIEPDHYVASPATLGIIVQLFCLYFFAGIAKYNEVWFSGNAMEYVLRLNIYVTRFGESLLNYPYMLKLITWSTLWGEIFLPWLLFLPFFVAPCRLFLFLAFWTLHLSIALSMDIGLFSFISMLAWVPLLPGGVWNRLKIYVPIRKAVADNNFRIGEYANKVALTICAFFVLFVIAWNVAAIPNQYCRKAVPQPMRWLGLTTNIRQQFQMFGYPPANPWFVYEATLKNGKQVDIFRAGIPVDHARPESVRESMPHHHWRKLHRNLVGMNIPQFRKRLAEYFVADWNRKHNEDEQVIKLTCTCYVESVGPGYNGVDRTSSIWGVYESEDAAGIEFEKLMKSFGIDDNTDLK